MTAPSDPEIACKQCNGKMKKDKKIESSIGLQILGIFIFLIGFAMLFVFPIGTIAGLILILAALRLGYKKKPVWVCPSCGYFFERA